MIISLTGFMACGKSSVGKQLCQILISKTVDNSDFIFKIVNNSKLSSEIVNNSDISPEIVDNFENNLKIVNNWEYIDLDNYIEEKAKLKIPEIFATKGEKFFRDFELSCLKEIVKTYCSPSDKNLVLSLGGGTPMKKECAKLIKQYTYCIYLEATPEEILKNLLWNGKIKDLKNLANRPLLNQNSIAFLEKINENLILENIFNQKEDKALIENITLLIHNLENRIEELINKRSNTYKFISHKTILVDGLSPSQIAEKLLS